MGLLYADDAPIYCKRKKPYSFHLGQQDLFYHYGMNQRKTIHEQIIPSNVCYPKQ